MIDLTICIPTIRIQNWAQLLVSLEGSVSRHNHEVILVGPRYDNCADGLHNVRYIKDYGHPARCFQIGSLLAEGRYLTWGSDDGLYDLNALSDCIDLMDKDRAKCDAQGPNGHDMPAVMTIQYTEGYGRSGQPQPKEYWTAHHHADQRLPGIPTSYKIAPVALMKTQDWLHMGGFDCKFEHINMCTHDLMFRMQHRGYRIIMSPGVVLRCDWNPNQGDHVPVMDAYHQNDLPYFQSIYNQADALEYRSILNIYNYKDRSDRVWQRRK